MSAVTVVALGIAVVATYDTLWHRATKRHEMPRQSWQRSGNAWQLLRDGVAIATVCRDGALHSWQCRGNGEHGTARDLTDAKRCAENALRE